MRAQSLSSPDIHLPAVLLPALVGEASLYPGLLAKGVNVSTRNARAGAEPAPGGLSRAGK